MLNHKCFRYTYKEILIIKTIIYKRKKYQNYNFNTYKVLAERKSYRNITYI